MKSLGEKKITDLIWEACSVVGGVFLFIIVTSYFFPTLDMLKESRLYIMTFFVALVLGKFILNKKRG